MMILPALGKLHERFRASEYRYAMLAAVVVGVLAGLGAVLFRRLIRLVQVLAYGAQEYSLSMFADLEWWHIILVPAAGGVLIAPIVYIFARETKGHGVPEVMEAVALKQGVIRKRIVAAKIMVSAVCIGTGGSVGREGPIVQIGSAIGSTLGQILHTSGTRLRTLVGCGAAAGIAATFNAPLAGVLFALEIILGDFGVRSFSPIVVASVIATAVSHKFVGDAPTFQIAIKYQMVSSYELLTHSLLGLAAGLVAVVFIRAVYLSEDLFDRMKIPPLLKPALAGLLVGIVGLRCPQIFGVGYEAIELALNAQTAWKLLLILVGIKLLTTSLTLGSGGSGGIFAPSLFLGAMVGGAIGYGFHSLFPSTTAGPGAYALVGMGAMVSAATHAPLTSIMIIFEMTNDYKIILPLMFACIIGNVVSSKLNRESIYTEKLARRGVNIHRGQEVNVLASLKVKSVASSKYLTIGENTHLGAMLHRMVNHPYAHFYVVDEKERLQGVVDVDDLRQVVLEGEILQTLVIARDVMRDDVPRLRLDDRLDKVMLLFGGAAREEFPVVDGEGGDRLQGVVTRQSLISAYNSEILKRDAAAEVVTGIRSTTGSNQVHLSGGIAVAEVEAPGWMAGKTLAQLNLRRTRGVQVLMVNPPAEGTSGKGMQHIPKPDYAFRLGDRILVLGAPEAIQALKG